MYGDVRRTDSELGFEESFGGGQCRQRGSGVELWRQQRICGTSGENNELLSSSTIM